MRNNLSAKTNFGFVSLVALHFMFLFLQFAQSSITPSSEVEDILSNNLSILENLKIEEEGSVIEQGFMEKNGFDFNIFEELVFDSDFSAYLVGVSTH